MKKPKMYDSPVVLCHSGDWVHGLHENSEGIVVYNDLLCLSSINSVPVQCSSLCRSTTSTVAD